MYKSPKFSKQLTHALISATTIFSLSNVHAQTSFPGIGREATSAEIKAWDIDVRKDLTGLPKGSGSVAKGNDVWDSKCASCHGVFGESNQVFTPLVGGTTKKDIEVGRVAGLIDGKTPYRTTLMKVSSISTMWDYINRAMPWNAPKSLTTDEVYAVVAYLLNMGEIVPDNFVLDQDNMALVKLPNRNGKTDKHGLWHVDGKPDVKAVSCMNNCGDAKVTSFLPDYARNAHGNIEEQNRMVGPYRGANTLKPAPTAAITAINATSSAQMAQPTGMNTATTAKSNASVSGISTAEIMPILSKNTCAACHSIQNKIVGPAFSDISKRYKSNPNNVAYLTKKIKAGGQGVWGAIPMPAQSISDTDANNVAQWIINSLK